MPCGPTLKGVKTPKFPFICVDRRLQMSPALLPGCFQPCYMPRGFPKKTRIVSIHSKTITFYPLNPAEPPTTTL